MPLVLVLVPVSIVVLPEASNPGAKAPNLVWPLNARTKVRAYLRSKLC
jgi:hypothetical protein